ncbi:MAG: sigma-70 family RNA polymerase sigma factor [Calditrichaceae bacterium]|jgi:RNA polymerase sigma-70 factor, ECF subfamily
MSDANILADGAAAENILNNSEDSLYKDQTTEKEKQIVEEREAILACQAGNKKAYRFIVERYKTRAYYAALMFTKNREDALDLSQEAFYRAYKAIKRFDTSRNFYTWFYKILKNICLNFIQFKKVRANSSQEFDETTMQPDGIISDRPDEIFEKNEQNEQIRRAIESLNDNDREIIILKEFDDMSYQEIADALNIPIGSVMSRLFYARKKLLKKLELIYE